MKSLIVNADDFGLTQRVSQGILHAHVHGIVTSTTLLANGDAFEAAVEMARQQPTLAIGAHLNLTQGTPVSPAEKVASLVNGRGEFRYSPGQLWAAIITRRVRLHEVETELRAQIEKIVSAGIAITHLDGHMNIHVLPGVSTCVVSLAREFRIAAVRCPREQISAGHSKRRGSPVQRLRQAQRNAITLAVSMLARPLKRKLENAGLRFTSHFYGTAQTGTLNAEVLAGLLKALPDGTAELGCHPGYFDAELTKQGGALTSERETEIEALTTPGIKSLVEAQRIQLITYREIGDVQFS